MKEVISSSDRILRSVTAHFGDYSSFWEIGTESPKPADDSSADPITRVAFINRTGEATFEVVMHDKEGRWFLATENDVSGANSVMFEYFKCEEEYSKCLLEVFPVGYNLQQLGVVVAAGEGEGASKTTRDFDKSEEYNSPKNRGRYAVIRTANDGRDYPSESFECAPTTEKNAVEIAHTLNNDSAHKHQYDDFYKVVQLPYRLGRGMEDAV